jgi:hypothetical protein
MKISTRAFLFLMLWAARSPGQNLLLNSDFGYDFGCRVLLLSEQSGGAEAGLSVRWYSSSDCSTGEIDSDVAPTLDASAVGFWTPVYLTAVAPPGAMSASVSMVVVQFAPGSPLTAQFDGAILAPRGSVPLPLLVDGFESEDLSAWQVTQP